MTRPNILVINPDQMLADVLHHLGCEVAYTPNIDALAADGVSFSNAFCQNPVCAPSRCSFMTGLYPHTNGHRTMDYMLRKGEKNLFQLLKNNDYYVWSSGRGDCLAGQDTKWLKECTDKIYNKCGADKITDDGRGDRNSKRYNSFYRGTVHTDNADGICHDNDYQWTVGCEKLIRNVRKGKPFFAFLGLMNPHPPYRAEQKYLDLIDESKIKPRIQSSSDSAQKPSMEYAIRKNLGIDGWDEDNFIMLRKTYLAMCARVDDMIGRLVQALKESGQYDNTAIFFFSDHGDFTGDYSLVEKAQNLFPDCLTNVPFIIKPPKGYEIENGANDNLVELIDFYATALDMVQAQTDHSHFGKSLVATMKNKGVPVREFVCCEGGRLMNETHCTEEVETYFGIKADDYEPRISVQQRNTGEHTKAVMIRTKAYKYVMRLYEQDEFYFLKNGESINEINNPDYTDIIQKMRMELLKWYMETCDEVPFEQDARFPDDYYLETVNALVHFKVSPIIKGIMKLTRNDFTTLINKALKAFKIDTNRFYKY
ncbi:MAG: sulfatase-like hydrolase/transferase [Eubacterium sp.]